MSEITFDQVQRLVSALAEHGMTGEQFEIFLRARVFRDIAELELERPDFMLREHLRKHLGLPALLRVVIRTNEKDDPLYERPCRECGQESTRVVLVFIQGEPETGGISSRMICDNASCAQSQERDARESRIRAWHYWCTQCPTLS